MDSKKLYKNILALVFTVLKSWKLRKEMVTDSELRSHIINQINNLLGLEEDFKISIKTKLSIMIAQVVVNQLGTEEQIEKPDFSVLEHFKKEYDDLLNYIDEKFPQLTFSSNYNSEIDVDEDAILSLPDFIEKQNLEYKDSEAVPLFKTETQLLEDKIPNEQRKVDEPDTSNNNEKISNSKENNNNNNNNEYNTKGTFNPNFNAQQLGLPINPILDPRFYPYKTKPKFMPLLKKISFVLFLIIAFFTVFIYGYSFEFMRINAYKSTSGNSYNIKSATGYSTVASALQFISFGGIFLPLLLIMVGTFLGFAIFSKKNAKKEKFHLSYMTLFFAVGMLITSLYYFVSYSIPSLFNNYITHFYESAYHIDDAKQDLQGAVNSLMNTLPVKIIHYLSIVALNFIGAELLILVIVCIYNPKIDHKKVRYAQYEYQKLIEAKFKGQEYEIDQSIFDNDEDNNNDKNK